MSADLALRVGDARSFHLQIVSVAGEQKALSAEVRMDNDSNCAIMNIIKFTTRATKTQHVVPGGVVYKRGPGWS